tara:strand:- start:15 stop:281 length:267 start_codon:yes stop_codon:yes gene_type:complete
MELKDIIVKNLEWSNKRLKLIDKGLSEEQLELIEFSLLHNLLQFSITDVSQQRELLKTFCEYVDLESHAHPDDIKLDIENHIKVFNCG